MGFIVSLFLSFSNFVKSVSHIEIVDNRDIKESTSLDDYYNNMMRYDDLADLHRDMGNVCEEHSARKKYSQFRELYEEELDRTCGVHI